MILQHGQAHYRHQHHHCHQYKDCDENDLELCIAGAEGEVRDSHKSRQERLNSDNDDGGDKKDDDDKVEEDDDDLDVVLESVGNQGLTEEGGHTCQHPSS